MTGYLKEGLKYPTPLSREDRELIDLVTTRYEGVEAPFYAYDGDNGYIELRSSPTIRMTDERMQQLREQFNDSKSVIEAETQDLHGLSNG